MLKILTTPIRRFLNKFGYEVTKLQNTTATFGSWLNKLDIQTIIDIGSNEGQFIKSINQTLPGRKILAFEPLQICYDRLLQNTKDLNITAYNYALSDHDGSQEINISENFVSSSILPMENLHKNLFPESKYINKQIITLKRLDDVVEGLSLSKNILLKIDVQGYENKVIAGGAKTIKNVSAVIIEYSYEPIYTGQWLFDDTYKYFTSVGFKFIGIADQALSANSGIPIYGDAIFIKNELARQLY